MQQEVSYLVTMLEIEATMLRYLVSTSLAVISEFFDDVADDVRVALVGVTLGSNHTHPIVENQGVIPSLFMEAKSRSNENRREAGGLPVTQR